MQISTNKKIIFSKYTWKYTQKNIDCLYVSLEFLNCCSTSTLLEGFLLHIVTPPEGDMDCPCSVCQIIFWVPKSPKLDSPWWRESFTLPPAMVSGPMAMTYIIFSSSWTYISLPGNHSNSCSCQCHYYWCTNIYTWTYISLSGNLGKHWSFRTSSFGRYQWAT